MSAKNTRNLFHKATGFVGGVSVALLLSLPTVAQQGPIDANSNTTPTPAPAAPNTYSPSTGDPTVRISPGRENSSDQIDRTKNPNSVQQPNMNRSGGNYNSVSEPYGTGEPANRTRYNDRSTGENSNTMNETNRQSTSGMGEYQSEATNPLQAPTGRSRYDDRSTGLNQDNYDRLSGADETDRSAQSPSNSGRTESRRIDNSSNQVQPQQRKVDSYTPDGDRSKQLQSDSPNQQNPNAGGSEGSGALGNTQSPTRRNSEGAGK